jgi:2'-5' RNA ligase
MARLFVAAWPPAEVVDHLARLLPRPPTAGVRWVPPENWHVTLRFLGRCDPGEAAAALDRLTTPPARAEAGPALVALGRSVLCVPVAGLEHLAAAVVAATAGIGQPPQPRAFHGHLTVARIDGRRSAAALGRIPVEARFGVGEVVLVASDTRPEGAVYHRLGSWALAGRPPGDG